MPLLGVAADSNAHTVDLATSKIDAFIGGAGNDNLSGNAGNDTINGGSGMDTAIYSGKKSDYTVTQNGTAANDNYNISALQKAA